MTSNEIKDILNGGLPDPDSGLDALLPCTFASPAYRAEGQVVIDENDCIFKVGLKAVNGTNQSEMIV